MRPARNFDGASDICIYIYIYIYMYIYMCVYSRKSIDARCFQVASGCCFQNAIATYTWRGVQTNDVHVARPRGERRWLATPQKRPMQTSHEKKVPSTGRHHSGTNDRLAY